MTRTNLSNVARGRGFYKRICLFFFQRACGLKSWLDLFFWSGLLIGGRWNIINIQNGKQIISWKIWRLKGVKPGWFSRVFHFWCVVGCSSTALGCTDWFSLLQKHEFREYWVSPFNELQKHIFAQQFTCSNRFQNHPYHSNTIIPPHWLYCAEKKEDLIVLTNLELFTFKAWANRCSKWFQWYGF